MPQVSRSNHLSQSKRGSEEFRTSAKSLSCNIAKKNFLIWYKPISLTFSITPIFGGEAKIFAPPGNCSNCQHVYLRGLWDAHCHFKLRKHSFWSFFPVIFLKLNWKSAYNLTWSLIMQILIVTYVWKCGCRSLLFTHCDPHATVGSIRAWYYTQTGTVGAQFRGGLLVWTCVTFTCI